MYLIIADVNLRTSAIIKTIKALYVPHYVVRQEG